MYSYFEQLKPINRPAFFKVNNKYGNVCGICELFIRVFHFFTIFEIENAWGRMW